MTAVANGLGRLRMAAITFAVIALGFGFAWPAHGQTSSETPPQTLSKTSSETSSEASSETSPTDSAPSSAPATSADPDVAFRRVRARRDLQFDLPGGPDAPEAEERDPRKERDFAWLARIGAFISRYGQYVIWAAVGLLGLGLAWFIFQSLRDVRLNRAGLAREADAKPALYQPEAARVRTLLEQVDALAREGHYREAVHMLLFRAIEDIDRARPGTVRRSLTSREIGRLPGLTPATRDAFVEIARINERGWFAGRDTDAAQFNAARAAYAQFDGRSTSQPRLSDVAQSPSSSGGASGGSSGGLTA